MGIYRNIKTICERNGRSILSIEKKLGLARSSMYKWEKNTPSVEKVQMVAQELGVTIDEILSVEANS